MRTLLLTLSMICLSISGQAQYYVKIVKGTVYLNNKVLKEKDKVNAGAKLRFSTADAHLHVMAPGSGVFILGVKDRKKKSPGEFILAIKDAIMPPDEYYAAATRAYEPYQIGIFEDHLDLKAFFRGPLFFIAPAKFTVSAENFPLDSTHYFLIRHQLSNGWFAKQLPQVGQTWEINPEVFLLKDKRFERTEILRSELYYVDQTNREERFLNEFQLDFPKPEQIKKELFQLYESIENLPAETFLQRYAMPYVDFEYGKTHPDAILKLIKTFEKTAKNGLH